MHQENPKNNEPREQSKCLCCRNTHHLDGCVNFLENKIVDGVEFISNSVQFRPKSRCILYWVDVGRVHSPRKD